MCVVMRDKAKIRTSVCSGAVRAQVVVLKWSFSMCLCSRSVSV